MLHTRDYVIIAVLSETTPSAQLMVVSSQVRPWKTALRTYPRDPGAMKKTKWRPSRMWCRTLCPSKETYGRPETTYRRLGISAMSGRVEPTQEYGSTVEPNAGRSAGKGGQGEIPLGCGGFGRNPLNDR